VTRLLGIDLGERRIGVAVAETDGSGARALTTIRRGRDPEADAAAIERLAREQGATELVVGLPLEASGDEGPQAALTTAWAALIGERLGLPIALRDERLSSVLAEQRLGPMRRGRSGGPPTAGQREVYRARVDREAAAIILQDELDARAAADAGRAAGREGPSDRSTAGMENSR
jgi:putative Holliday junction resolvase